MTDRRRRARPRRAAPLLLAALALALVACTAPREPAYDPAIAGAVTDLAVESQSLFGSLTAAPPEPFSERADLYRRLSARAEAVRVMAENRPAPRPLPLAAAGEAALAGLLGPRGIAPDRAARRYSAATPAFMADYLRNLDRLESADRADPDGPPAPARVRLRIAALSEVLRDTLTYERRVLRRGQ